MLIEGKVRILTYAVFALSALASAAKAYDFPRCWPKSKTVATVPLSKAPAALRRALAKDVGWMAEPGGSFNATDVADTRIPSDRLIFIWHDADIWVVATEHGGIAYSDPIFAYRLEGSRVTLVETIRAFPNTVYHRKHNRHAI